MSWNLNINGILIGKSQALLNQVGRKDRRMVAKQSIKKFASTVMETNVLQQDGDVEDERNINMETIVSDDASDSSSLVLYCAFALINWSIKTADTPEYQMPGFIDNKYILFKRLIKNNNFNQDLLIKSLNLIMIMLVCSLALLMQFS